MKPVVEDILLAAAMLAWFALVATLCSCERLHRVPTRDDLLKARAADAAIADRVSSIFGGGRRAAEATRAKTERTRER